MSQDKRSYISPALTDFGSVNAVTAGVFKCSPGSDNIVGTVGFVYEDEIHDSCTF